MADAPIQPSVFWPTYSARNSRNVSGSDGQTLGRDEFLKLLITQLKHQDPMQPLEDREFIAQMAQFSALEQLMNMASEIQALRQSLGITPDYIGKRITWLELDESGTKWEEMSGVVDGIAFGDGVQYAIVGNRKVALEQIVLVRVNDGSAEPEEGQEEPPVQEENPPAGDAEDGP